METWEKKETGIIREGEREGEEEERVWRDCKGMCTCVDCGCLVEQKVGIDRRVSGQKEFAIPLQV